MAGQKTARPDHPVVSIKNRALKTHREIGGGAMWKYKGCPHCHGDVFIEEDVDNSYLKCLQCGYEKALHTEVFPVRKEAVHRKRRMVNTLG
jgi:hypothetical protein